jgi:hypothetical protein
VRWGGTPEIYVASDREGVDDRDIVQAAAQLGLLQGIAVDRFARGLTGPTSGQPLTPMGPGDISIALARQSDAAFPQQFKRNHELTLREEPR